MKTENFDDAIRRKVENVNHQYSGEDIDRVYNYVIKHKTFPWRRDAVIVVSVATAMMMGGLLIHYINQQETNQQLLQKIDTLQHKLAHTVVSSSLVKADTVYVTKYIVQTQPIQKDKNEASIKANNNTSNVSEEKSESISYNGNTDPSEKSASSNIPLTSRQTKFKTDLNSKKKNTSGSHLNVENNPSLTQNDPTGNANAKDENSSARELAENGIEKTSPVALSEPSVNVTKESVLSSAQPLAQNGNGAVSADTLPTKKVKFHNPLSSLNNFQYRAGIGVEGGSNQLGFSVLAETFLSKRWSVSAGLKFMSIHDHFHDANDFSNKKGNDFRGVYTPNGSDTSFVSNIDMMNYLVQVPLALTYNLPLKNSFTLLFGAGTDMDIYAQQRTTFEHWETINTVKHEHVDTKYPTVLFNNIVLSVGVEKKWNRFAFQATPYISPQLTSVAYKKENVYFGFRLRALYSFGK